MVASTTDHEPAATPAVEDDAAPRPTPGALLRAARERQGMHLATLAAAIKVSPRKLEALEDNRWDELPGPTFTRALAQAVCRVLKTDPRPVLVLMPPADTSMLDSTVGNLNEPFAGRAGDLGRRLWVPRRPAVVAAVLLLLGAMLVLWVPKSWFGRLAGPAAPARSAASAASTGAPAPLAVPAFDAASAVAQDAATPAPGLPAAAAPPAVEGTAGQTSAETAAEPARAPQLPAVSPAGVLQILASGPSWIEVRDAQGRILLSRTLTPGEPVALTGAPPLQLVVGDATVTRVVYKGRLIDLGVPGRDNVARVELR